MGCLRTFVAVGVLATIFAANAQAADVPRYRTLPPSPPPLPLQEKPLSVDEFVSGWYLRGDLGYRFQHVRSASDPSTSDFVNNSIHNAAMGGLGAGYKAQWFRVDLTGDYGWRSLYSGTSASGASGVSNKIDTFTVMVNGYLDLGTWAHITPYVGAGIGGAYLSMSSYETTPVTVAAVPTVARWNVAWAAMAGLSYNLSHNLLVDIGYRHVALGDVIGGPTSNQIKIKALTGDEIRVGLRYLLD